MKFYLPKQITVISSNVAENEAEDGTLYTAYDVKLGYNVGTIRQYGTSIFEALTTLYPLAHYVWEDSVVTDKYALNLHTQTAQYPVGGAVLVPIVNGVTVVFVRSNNKYYIAKTTATVDFMLESITAPANFNEITAVPVPYRNQYQYPVDGEDTLYWGYNGVANKYRFLDRAIGTQTIKHGTTLTLSLSMSACSAMSFFNVLATSVLVNVYDMINPLAPVLLYTTTVDFVDTSHLDTYEKVCTVPAVLSPSGTIFFSSRYAQKVDLTFTGVTDPAVGAIKAGLLDYLGVTLDGVDVGFKSYNIMEQRANGEIVWNKDNLETNKTNTLRYNIRLVTSRFDPTAVKLKSIIDKEVVLLGDDGDTLGYRTLHSYGAVKDANATLYSNNEKSPATLSIENFV